MTAVGLASASEYSGSARFTALSGAMGAIGVEASSLVRNPAGIALLRGGNRMTLTLGAFFPSYSQTWYGQKSTTSGENRYPLQEFAYQKGTDVANGGRIAFAFAVRRAGSFDHTISGVTARLDHKHSSLADYMAAMTNNSEYDKSRAARILREAIITPTSPTMIMEPTLLTGLSRGRVALISLYGRRGISSTTILPLALSPVVRCT